MSWILLATVFIVLFLLAIAADLYLGRKRRAAVQRMDEARARRRAEDQTAARPLGQPQYGSAEWAERWNRGDRP